MKRKWKKKKRNRNILKTRFSRDEQAEHRGILGSETTLYETIKVDTFVPTHRTHNINSEL